MNGILRVKALPRVVTFLYHEVTDDPTLSGFQIKAALPYKHTLEEFDKNLAQRRLSRMRPLLVDQIDFNSPGKFLMLTFDDGGKSACYIADQLEKKDGKNIFSL